MCLNPGADDAGQALIVGVNDAVLGQAVKAGLLRKHDEGFLLNKLDAFRTTYIFPSEISKWFDGSGLRFARTMAEAGIRPVATLHKINIWRRSDVVQTFGGRYSWNMKPFESAMSEFGVCSSNGANLKNG